ncbi:hypothetical protein ACJJTC_017417 [Scirpophaga incertulas]
MFAKLFVVIALAMVASGLEYPPGVNPAACLDYPFCRQKLARVLPMSVPELVYSPTILPAAPITVRPHISLVPIDLPRRDGHPILVKLRNFADFQPAHSVYAAYPYSY